jgi:hypothetical protein
LDDLSDGKTGFEWEMPARCQSFLVVLYLERHLVGQDLVSNRPRRNSLLLLFLFPAMMSFCFMTGCGKSKPQPITRIVTGQIHFNEKPLGNVELRFYEPAKGYAAFMTTKSTGEFASEKPIPVGTYLVSISGGVSSDQNEMAIAEGEAGNAMQDEAAIGKVKVPKHYLDGATSDLEAHVTPHDTYFEFKLEPGPRKSQRNPGVLDQVVVPVGS